MEGEKERLITARVSFRCELCGFRPVGLMRTLRGGGGGGCAAV